MSPVSKIALCFCIALITAFIARIALGKRHDLWFKRQIPKSIITLRSQISMYLAIGTPTCKQGLYFSIGLVLFILIEILLIWHLC